MGLLRTTAVAVFLTAMTTVGALAAICDYRPSQLLGGSGAALGAVAGGVAATGAGAKAVGVYTLVHATSGLTMVGGTWAGASAAGTAGIISGTGGAAGATVAVLTAPATIVVGGTLAVVTGTFEGACYFSDTRITDYDEINAIVENISLTAPPDLYRYHAGPKHLQDAMVKIRDPDSAEPKYDEYLVRNLYIVNGVIKNRDWGLNTTIGIVGKIE